MFRHATVTSEVGFRLKTLTNSFSCPAAKALTGRLTYMRLQILLTLFSRKEFVTMRDQARHTILVPNGPSQIILQVVGF
jgi:hypothetical protein